MMRAGAHQRSRFRGRVEVVARASVARLARARAKPADPERILVAHHLLLGDTLMLTPLFAKLRAAHPRAAIVTTVAEPIAPLYATRPYGVRAIGWTPRALSSELFAEAPFDLAIVPGDNRYAWLAAAMRSRWILAFAGDAPAPKNWPIDELVGYPDSAGAWGDIVAALVDGPPPPPFSPNDWRMPSAASFKRPSGRYAVLHVGASSPLKQWLPERWSALAAWLDARALTPVWSAGKGEETLVRMADPVGRFASFAAALSLSQMWHLIAEAELLIAPDTGIAHLGRVAGTPTIALFGPGSATICGAGEFWRNVPYRAVTVDPFPCRDQRVLFRREIPWVRRCGRTTAQCASPRCMHAIGIDAVTSAIGELGVAT